ncbi:MAG TPA: hypothetical protein PLM07_08995 [Candidatus Rifleibacterium sp.]|nr:hypothetical protein [Candidatus Rifleibacterium sp.]HPT46022.1 hypothetical protein [Candidatus Rifleibacterium sp.]
MEITFSKAELEKLVEIAVMADWVMTAHDTEDDERKDDYLKLIQKIFAYAWKNGMKKEIEFLEDIKEYFPDEAWEENTLARAFINEFEEKTFWDELVERLAERELNKKLGDKKAGSFEEHMEIYEGFAAKFGEEFAEHGVDNIQVAAPAATPKPARKR